MFRLFGFPVQVRPGFVMFMVLIVVLYGNEFGVWLAGSLAAFTLLHELGHAVAARRTGAEARISLNFLAGKRAHPAACPTAALRLELLRMCSWLAAAFPPIARCMAVPA